MKLLLPHHVQAFMFCIYTLQRYPFTNSAPSFNLQHQISPTSRPASHLYLHSSTPTIIGLHSLSPAQLSTTYPLNRYPRETLLKCSGLYPHFSSADGSGEQCLSRSLGVICGFLCSQGHEIHHNVTAGVILSDHSLVLQGVTRHTAGDYTCLAANTEGKGTSNPATLRVMCKYPLCLPALTVIHAAGSVSCKLRMSSVNIAFYLPWNWKTLISSLSNNFDLSAYLLYREKAS
jgi:hypothetical protein